MSRWLVPLAAGLVRSEVAGEVISPPYDLLTPNERAEHAREHRRSFLNGTPSEGDDPALDLSGRRRQAIEYLERELAAGTWHFLPEGLFVLQIESGGRVQTGVVGDVPASTFPEVIRPHEHTRPDRVHDLASYLANVGYFSSPVGLTYRRRAEIDSIVDEATTEAPDLDATLPDGDRHRVWHLGDPSVVKQLLSSFDDVLTAYIIDGHHRVAATLQRGADPSAKAGRFLAVAFPDDDLAIYPFHRWIEGSIQIARRGATDLTASPGRAVILTPDGEDEIDLAVEPGEADVTALARTVLGPLFGVEDERTDPRLTFVPGYPGPARLRNRVKEQGGVGFLLAPTTVEAVMQWPTRAAQCLRRRPFSPPSPDPACS